MKKKCNIYRILFFIGLLLIIFLYFLVGLRLFLHKGIFDEGLATYGAVRVLNGDIPYRDFWTLYTPAEFYLLAIIFKIFGASIIVERMLNVIIHLLIVIAIYFIIKGLFPERFVLLCCFLVSVWLRRMITESYSYSLAVPPAIFFVILSCWFLERYFSTTRRKYLIISGFLVGIVVLFRQDFGFYTIVSEYFVIFIFLYNNALEKSPIIIIRKSMSYLLGIFVIISPMILYFVFNSSFYSMIQDIIMFPLIVYPQVRAISFPEISINTVIFYFPIVIFMITAVILACCFFKDVIFSERERYRILLFLLLGISFLNYPFLRAQIRYLFPTMLLAIILFIYLFYKLLQKISLRRVVFYKYSIYGVVFIIGLSLFVYPAILEAKNYLVLRRNLNIMPLSLERARGCYDWDENIFHQQRAIRFIQKHVGPKERIFVGNMRHDKLVYNDIMFYFLSERQSATKYHELHPGLVDTERIQNEIINELNKAEVQYIILYSCIAYTNETDHDIYGAHKLDDFIQERYKIEKSFGPYLVLKRIQS